MKLEAQLEKKAIALLESHGFIHIKSDTVKRGWPDRIAFGPNAQCLMLEFKATGGKKSPAQIHMARLFGQRGFTVHEIRSLEELQALLPTGC